MESTVTSGLLATILVAAFATGYGIRLSFREWRGRK